MPRYHLITLAAWLALAALALPPASSAATDPEAASLAVVINRNGFTGPIHRLPGPYSTSKPVELDTTKPIPFAAGRHTLAIGGTGMNWDISFTVARSAPGSRLEIQPESVSPVTAATGSKDRLGLQIVMVTLDWGAYRGPIRIGAAKDTQYSGSVLHYPLVRGFGAPIHFEGGTDHALIQVDNSGFVAISRFPRSLEVSQRPGGGATLRIRTRSLVVAPYIPPNSDPDKPVLVRIGSIAVPANGGTYAVVADYPVHIDAKLQIDLRWLD